jgi:hypothetical protein
MDGFSAGAVMAGIASTAAIVSFNSLCRRVLFPFVKIKFQDRPEFSGEWHGTLVGEAAEQFALTLRLRHYAPYVRGELEIRKRRGELHTSQSSLRVTGYICDDQISLAGRTRIKPRRSISTLLLSICPQSKTLTGTYSFYALDNRTFQTESISFSKVGI